MSLTFANKITLCRIVAVPFYISALLYISTDRDYLRFWALGIFLAAVISDVVDGYIARTRNQKTLSGAILDPLADKLLLISSFICLYKMGETFAVTRFPLWFVVGVISRDVVLLVGSLLIYTVHGKQPVEATLWGKSTTFFQVLTVIFMLLQIKAYSLWAVALILTFVSGVDYIRRGIKIMNTPTEAIKKENA